MTSADTMNFTTVAFTAAEYAALEEASRKQGLSRGEFIQRIARVALFPTCSAEDSLRETEHATECLVNRRAEGVAAAEAVRCEACGVEVRNHPEADDPPDEEPDEEFDAVRYSTSRGPFIFDIYIADNGYPFERQLFVCIDYADPFTGPSVVHWDESNIPNADEDGTGPVSDYRLAVLAVRKFLAGHPNNTSD